MGDFCAEWMHGVCCRERELARLNAVWQVIKNDLAPCSGCVANAEAALCAMACSPEVTKTAEDPASSAVQVTLPKSFCEHLESSCASLPTGGKGPTCVNEFFDDPLFMLLHNHSSRGKTPHVVSTDATSVEPVANSCTAPAQHHHGVPARHRHQEKEFVKFFMSISWYVAGVVAILVIIGLVVAAVLQFKSKVWLPPKVRESPLVMKYFMSTGQTNSLTSLKRCRL